MDKDRIRVLILRNKHQWTAAYGYFSNSEGPLDQEIFLFNANYTLNLNTAPKEILKQQTFKSIFGASPNFTTLSTVKSMGFGVWKVIRLDEFSENVGIIDSNLIKSKSGLVNVPGMTYGMLSITTQNPQSYAGYGFYKADAAMGLQPPPKQLTKFRILNAPPSVDNQVLFKETTLF